MIIVGGTYDEICFEPRWEEKYGSGLRACRTITGVNSNQKLDFYTFGNENTKTALTLIKSVFPNIESHVTHIDFCMSFYYDHPLTEPQISPRLDTINKSLNQISITGQDVLLFGMIEGNAIVNAKRVVYDPQSPSNPIPFSATGSQTEELIYVVNFGEAKKMARSGDMAIIEEFFFLTEKADVLVLKMGPQGALVKTKGSASTTHIPVYETSSVWPIGSGDVFASVFAYFWFQGKSTGEAASMASKNTAIYCQTKSYNFALLAESLEELVIESKPTGRVYLAGPFFNFSQRWLIDQIRSSLMWSGLPVFSPWHDIGHGVAADVVHKDIEGLEKSQLVFAVIDGLDSGTLFEVGYAVKKGIPVIAYVENESEESIKMLEGTGCIIEKDLTSAIYKTYWTLGKHG